MGFDKSLVGEVMKKRIDQNRAGYESAEQLLDAVIEAQKWETDIKFYGFLFFPFVLLPATATYCVVQFNIKVCLGKSKS